MLRRHYSCTRLGLPLSKLRYIFPKDWKSGASLGQMQGTSEAYIFKECLSKFFDQLDSFDIQYTDDTDDQKLFNILVVLNCESISVPEEKFKNTKTTYCIGKHVPISVSISANLKAMPIFLCNFDPRDLVESLIDVDEGLATQSKAQMKLKFLEVETAIKI